MVAQTLGWQVVCARAGGGPRVSPWPHLPHLSHICESFIVLGCRIGVIASQLNRENDYCKQNYRDTGQDTKANKNISGPAQPYGKH